jgi:hypothetical protein
MQHLCQSESGLALGAALRFGPELTVEKTALPRASVLSDQGGHVRQPASTPPECCSRLDSERATKQMLGAQSSSALVS